MGIDTVAAHLGLVKASVLSIILLVVGGVFTGTAFLLGMVLEAHPLLAVSLLAVAVADYIVLKGYMKLYFLSKNMFRPKAKALLHRALQNCLHAIHSGSLWSPKLVAL